MKLFTCCLLLLFATMVVTVPIRGKRENVLSFLNDAVGTTTERTTTACRKPPSKPVEEQDSEDMSDEKSTERFDTNGFTDAFKDPDSDEITIPKVVEKDKAPSKSKTGADKDNMGPMDMSSRQVQGQGSREDSGPHWAHQAGRDQTDLNSDEGVTVEGAQHLSGKQVVRSRGDQVIDSASLGTDLQRKATPGRVDGLNAMLAPGGSRELLDQDSLEENNGRPAPVGNRGDIDYDETREFISSETYLIGASAPPEHMPSSLSLLAKSRASR